MQCPMHHKPTDVFEQTGLLSSCGKYSTTRHPGKSVHISDIQYGFHRIGNMCAKTGVRPLQSSSYSRNRYQLVRPLAVNGMKSCAAYEAS